MLLPALLLSLGPAAVDPASSGPLVWQAPEECPSAAEVEAEIVDLLGDPEMAKGDAPRFEATVVRESSGQWRLDLNLVDGDWSRTLRASSCDDLGAAAALMVATSIDPLAGLADEAAQAGEGEAAEPESETGEPEPDPESEPEREPEPDPDPDPDPEPPPWGLLRGELGLGVGGGRLPAPHAVLETGVSLGRPRVLGRLALRTGLPVTRDVQTGSIDLWSLHVAPAACGRFVAERVAVPACLGAALGLVQARPSGLDQARVATLFSAEAELDAGLEVRIIDTVWIYARAGFGIGLSRPGFEVQGAGEVHRAGAFTGRGTLGVVVQRPLRGGDRRKRRAAAKE